jgi:ribonuclease P protein 1
MFNPHILVDCGYEPYMTPQNIQNCTKQMLLMWSENRDHYNPFHLVFCNLSPESLMYNKFTRRLIGSETFDFPFYHTSKHYLDLYPKERLVYLTPHCTEDLECYHPDDIYIIGKDSAPDYQKPVDFPPSFIIVRFCRRICR